MAYCMKCGTENADDAAFCGSCGAPAAPATPLPVSTGGASRPRTGKAGMFIVIAVVLVAVLGVGGWFLKGYFDEKATSERARAQAEVAADFIEGAFISYDVRLVRRSIPSEYADSAEEMMEGDSGDGSKVTRKWKGDRLLLTVPDEYTVSIESDGDDESAEATVDTGNAGGGEGIVMTLELDGNDWVIVAFNGRTIGEGLE